MSKTFLFPATCLAFIFGVLTASVSFGYVLIFLFAFLGFRVVLVYIRRHELERKNRRRLFLILIIITLVFFSFGYFRTSYYLSNNTPDLKDYYDQKVSIIGFISSDPELGVINQKFSFRPLKIIISGELNSLSEGQVKNINLSAANISVTAAVLPEYEYGQVLKIQAYFSSPCLEEQNGICKKMANTDGFISRPYILILGAKDSLSFRVYRFLFRLKRSARQIINRGLSEPESGLANALILGYKRTLSSEDLNNFSRAGLSHLVAISGTHITLISAILLKVLLFIGFSRRRAFPLAATILVAYTVLTGFQSSAVRSLIMGILSLMAVHFGRSYNVFRALVFSAALMIYFDPKILINDLGFQLSFLAMLDLIFIYPRFKDRLDILESYLISFVARLKGKWEKAIFKKFLNFIIIVFDMLLVTVAAQLSTWPISAINFNQVSLVAPLANLAAIWAFDILMIILLLALFLSVLLPGSWFWFFPSYFILKYVLWVGSFFASWPGASVFVLTGWRAGAFYYLLLAIWIFKPELNNKINYLKMDKNSKIR